MTEIDNKISRSIEVWTRSDPASMAGMDEIAQRYAFADMRHDILILYSSVKLLRASLEQVLDLLLVSTVANIDAEVLDFAKEVLKRV